MVNDKLNKNVKLEKLEDIEGVNPPMIIIKLLQSIEAELIKLNEK